MIFDDRYGDDVLSADPHRHGDYAHMPASTAVEARPGLVVEDVDTGFVGAVTRVGRVAGAWRVELEDRRGGRRSFPLGRGFWIDGRPVELVRPAAAPAPTGRVRTASGSLHVRARARTARASRIWVEGRHDAELVAKVWGEDLALEGVVVEELKGVDRLEDALAAFGPSPVRRAGVLVDHLVPGSKESRIAQEVTKRWPGAILVLGHPFVDIWQAVKPERVGVREWPDVPRGVDIKRGTLEALGWPHADQRDIAAGWRRILSTVRTYRDLEPALLGRVEELIDFVTVPWAL